MGDDTDLRVAVAVLQNELANLKKQMDSRATREWTLISGIAILVITIFTKLVGLY